MTRTAVSLFAHPDDAEFMCVGTLALLRQKGWKIHIATMTAGDCGSAELNREQISEVRRSEAANSAKLLDGDYHCLECNDVFVMYDRPTLLKVIEVIRLAKPDIVFAPSPVDYMVDHEITSKLAWAGCFAAGIPNIDTPGVGPFDKIPHLYYGDAMDGKDNFSRPIQAGFHIDITSVMNIKEKMLCCHASQSQWLLTHHGIDEYTASLRRQGQMRGKEIGVAYAEAFRQHLGHAFPQDNLLEAELSCFYHALDRGGRR